MEYRQLGVADLKITEVALGAWAIGGWLWGGTDEKLAVAGIQTAVDLGMTTLDTAPMYGFGLSEEIVGRAIKGRRDKVQVLTKFGLRWDAASGTFYFDTKDPRGHAVKVYKWGGAKSVFEECEASLRRLGTDVIDLYQHHWPDESTPIEETMDACSKLLKQGKIRAVGVSNYTIEMMEAARKVVPLASDQPPYSMLKREIEKDVVPWCVEHKVGLVVYSPLQNGILAGKTPPARQFGEGDLRTWSPFYKPENRRRILVFLDGLRPIAESHRATVAQVVINWTIHRPGITCALVGVRNPDQARENAGAASFKLTEAETKQIDAALAELKLEM
jgi:aryl-alcohol dehydrogenase-like predicted oxidoreductase